MRPANPQPTPEPASAGVVHPANKQLFLTRPVNGSVTECALSQLAGLSIPCTCALILSKAHLALRWAQRASPASSMIGLSAFTVSMVSASAADLSGR